MSKESVLRQAIANDETLEITYVKFNGEQSRRTISEITPSDEWGEGYIHAYCHLRDDYRTFKIYLNHLNKWHKVSRQCFHPKHATHKSIITRQKLYSILQFIKQLFKQQLHKQQHVKQPFIKFGRMLYRDHGVWGL